MPEKSTTKRAQKAKRRGNKPSTQAGAYVREEMHHKRNHKHPVKNKKQAIAIGLSKARNAGVRVPQKQGSRSSTSPSRSHANKKAA